MRQVFFSDELPLKLDTDASNYGVGAGLSHIYLNSEEQPIAFASGTLNKSERNYPQIEKEALSIVVGIRKFHQYLHCRKFVLVTDNKSLETVRSQNRNSDISRCMYAEVGIVVIRLSVRYTVSING